MSYLQRQLAIQLGMHETAYCNPENAWSPTEPNAVPTGLDHALPRERLVHANESIALATLIPLTSESA